MTGNLPGPIVLMRDTANEFLLPAELLAELFGWPIQTLRNHMRRGLVASRVERGVDEDAGRWRLSIRCGNRRWRAVVEADGTVGTHSVEVLPALTPRTAC